MTDGEPETVVSAILQKIKSIKKQLIFFLLFYFIKSETSDSFVNHFDGHFAYLKTLDFYFKEGMGQGLFSCIMKMKTRKLYSRSYILNFGTLPTLSCGPAKVVPRMYYNNFGYIQFGAIQLSDMFKPLCPLRKIQVALPG